MKENTHFCNYEAVTTRKKKKRHYSSSESASETVQFDNVLGLD